MEFIFAIAAIIFFVNWISTPEKVEPKIMVKYYRDGYELNEASNLLTEEGWKVDSVTVTKDGEIIVVYKSAK